MIEERLMREIGAVKTHRDAGGTGREMPMPVRCSGRAEIVWPLSDRILFEDWHGCGEVLDGIETGRQILRNSERAVVRDFGRCLGPERVDAVALIAAHLV